MGHSAPIEDPLLQTPSFTLQRKPAVAEGPARRCPNPRGHQARQAVQRQLRALEAAAREKREGEAREAAVEVAGRSFRARVDQQRLAQLLPARLRRRLSRVTLHQRLDCQAGFDSFSLKTPAGILKVREEIVVVPVPPDTYAHNLVGISADRVQGPETTPNLQPPVRA
eukprot:2750024-Pyramimonas_sp.AAC.1